MNQDSLEVASDMLRALIAGASCEAIGQQHGVSKSAVSQKVRLLANDLQQIVGVVDVDEQESPTAALIRQHGDAYLEALEHYDPEAATSLRTGFLARATLHLDQYVAKIRSHSRCAERDTALLFTLFSTAAKPLEIAQLEVADYLDATGDVRMHSSLRPEIAVNRVARALLFRSPAVIAAIDAYLAQRLRSGMGTHASPSYRGLHPHSRLFLSRTGHAMRLQYAGPDSRYCVCKEIHEIYRRIFAYGHLPGINTAFARRVAAQRLREDGAHADEIGHALGVRKLAVYKLLQTG